MRTISEEQYGKACADQKEAQEVINLYHRERAIEFKERIASGVPFKDDELRYSRTALCPCGHGIAYPTGCGGNHYWDCSAVLKGIDDKSIEHCGKLDFMTYDVKSENEDLTTRGVYKPKPKLEEVPKD